ncbi:ankyrin repeat-containing domain protein [Fusarium venenatum]|uniref:ankyrin repeat-containing domain protein n=1 Tax=Fusarium venenatum TaxID=56646 RepID=UPI001DFEF0E0|nr:ankyrin repeat-containing domain protein [Fusarium venenatum]
MTKTCISGKMTCLEELPTEIKGLIMDEISLLPNPYSNLLNLAHTCKQLSTHALPHLYLNDVRNSLGVDNSESNMPLALQWACWFGVLEAAKMSLEGLRRAGVVNIKRKIDQTFDNGTLYNLRCKKAKKTGPSGPALSYGYLHWGSRSDLLHLACLRGNTAIAELLISTGADPDAPDGKGLPPLAYALNEDVVKFLIKRGADVNVTHSGSDETALCHLISWGPRDQCDWQKEFNTPHGGGALNLSDIHQDQLGAIRYLILHANADIYANKIDRVNPLRMAALTRYIEVVQILLEAGASSNPLSIATNSKRFLLADALKSSRNHCVVNMLLEFGAEADLDQIPDHDLTKLEGDQLPIMHLTTPGSNPRYAKEEADMAEIICKKIKHFNIVVDGHRPLWHYVRQGRIDIGRILIKHGASPQLANVEVLDDVLELVAN